MLTARCVFPNGMEEVIEGNIAEFDKNVAGKDEDGVHHGSVRIIGDDSHRWFYKGTVYLMNRYGKTVAIYELTQPAEKEIDLGKQTN